MKAQHFVWLGFITVAAALAIDRNLIDLRNAGQWRERLLAVALISLGIGITQVGKTGVVEWGAAVCAIFLGLSVLWPDAVAPVTQALAGIGGGK